MHSTSGWQRAAGCTCRYCACFLSISTFVLKQKDAAGITGKARPARGLIAELKGNKENRVSEKLENEVKYLFVKHIYQCGRDLNVKSFDENFKISEKMKKIEKSTKNFNDFYRYLEEIVAYMKYYGFDDK